MSSRSKLRRLASAWRGDERPKGATDDTAPTAGADPADREIINAARPLTLTGSDRLLALIDAVRYIEDRRIGGALAECGVWRGGSVFAMVLTLQQIGAEPRDIYLYDTFEGMTQPTAADTSRMDRPALEQWDETDGNPFPEFFDPESFNEEAVRSVLLETGYPADRLHFVRGDVLETLPASSPPSGLALLRLDTDWYESTRHELEHLYPLLGEGGVLIVDDYGHWDGSRQAVDEYFASGAPPPLLSRIDYTARIGVKHQPPTDAPGSSS